jgi:hypothetical protein
MIDPNVPEELSAQHLMAFVRHLSVVIGPRRPTSRAERQAASYIHSTIRQLSSRWELVNQPFRSINGFRYRLAPLAALTGLSLMLGLRRDRQAQVFGGLLSVGLSVMSRDAFLARPAVWETWLPRGESENVIVSIPPRRKAQRRVVFIAHLDSGVHRLTTDPRIARHLPQTLGGITLLGLVGGVLTLESTEVILAFTGSATAISTGADSLATACGQVWNDALWVVVSNVGAGELCWVTRHGVSPYAYYHPHPDAEKVMERVADARPDLGMMGKSMLTVDEVSILRDRDLCAVALMGYDRVTGLIPHWRQNSDTIHAIDPVVIERAAHACWTVAQVMDQAESWPPST